MDGRINPHRYFVCIFAGNLFVHVEQVSVPLSDDFLAQAFDGVGKIKINPESARSDAPALIADLLGSAGGDIARGEVAKAGAFSLQDVVAVLLGDRGRWFPAILFAFGNPDAAVVAQR